MGKNLSSHVCVYACCISLERRKQPQVSSIFLCMTIKINSSLQEGTSLPSFRGKQTLHFYPVNANQEKEFPLPHFPCNFSGFLCLLGILQFSFPHQMRISCFEIEGIQKFQIQERLETNRLTGSFH